MDILIRSFFIFVACFLLFSYTVRGFFSVILLSLFTTSAINIFYEVIWGKKYWRRLKAQPQKPKRPVKTVLKDLWRRAFSRDKTKGFVWAGIIILMMSFFVRLNIYYIIFACAIFIFAAMTRFATINGENESNPVDSQKDSQPIEAK